MPARSKPLEQARRWHDSHEYAQARAAAGGEVSTMVAVEGL